MPHCCGILIVGIVAMAPFSSGAVPVPMPFVQSGFGDGAFPIYEILRDSARVGAEVVFIDTEKGPSP